MKELICPNKDEVDELIYLKGTLLRNGAYKIGLYMGQPLILDVILLTIFTIWKIKLKKIMLKP